MSPERWRWVGADGCSGGEYEDHEEAESSMAMWDSAYPVKALFCP